MENDYSIKEVKKVIDFYMHKNIQLKSEYVFDGINSNLNVNSEIEKTLIELKKEILNLCIENFSDAEIEKEDFNISLKLNTEHYCTLLKENFKNLILDEKLKN